MMVLPRAKTIRTAPDLIELEERRTVAKNLMRILLSVPNSGIMFYVK